jgi:hypothetical protein
MDNHYHFVLHTHQPNLSRLMRHINGVYTQAYNRCDPTHPAHHGAPYSVALRPTLGTKRRHP